MMKKTTTIDAYISDFDPEIQLLLEKVRKAVMDVAPDATEAIKYGMPTFVWNGNLVHFAAYSKHIGFYPAPSGVPEFADDLALYQAGKGTMQFPYNKPLPLSLIRRIVRYRMDIIAKKRKT